MLSTRGYPGPQVKRDRAGPALKLLARPPYFTATGPRPLRRRASSWRRERIAEGLGERVGQRELRADAHRQQRVRVRCRLAIACHERPPEGVLQRRESALRKLLAALTVVSSVKAMA